MRNEIKRPLTKEKAIKWLDNADIGIPVVVILNNNIRCVSLFIDKNDTGLYTFYDETGMYKCTTGFILEKVTLDMLRENELETFMSLMKKVKEVI